MAIEVRPITEDDARRVGEFLHAHMNARVAAAHWSNSLAVPWDAERPNGGFMLLDGDAVVGVHLAFYSRRTIDDRPERFCNLGAFCVLPEYRFHSVRLLKALLAQEGYHFTDLSPSGNVPDINARLGFRSLDTTTALVPNLPWPSWRARGRISSDLEEIERTLCGRELALYRDHAATAAARHLVLIRGEEWCYVIFRGERYRRLPGFALLLHVSHPELLRAMGRPLARHLLLRHGRLATLAEERIVKHRPRFSFGLKAPKRRMFLSPHLTAGDIDYLYSELVCVSW